MASSTLDLSTKLLAENPFLLALSPAILLCASIISIPFLTLVFRLLLIGYTTGDQVHGSLEWHVRGWANWAIVFTVCIWLWTWGVARGILKMTCAGVIGSWYFAEYVSHPTSFADPCLTKLSPKSCRAPSLSHIYPHHTRSYSSVDATFAWVYRPCCTSTHNHTITHSYCRFPAQLTHLCCPLHVLLHDLFTCRHRYSYTNRVAWCRYKRLKSVALARDCLVHRYRRVDNKRFQPVRADIWRLDWRRVHG